MLPQVKLLDEMDDQMWSLLQRNLTGITEAEADWRPHPEANNVRWLVGHLAWFEEWAHDALRQEGRYHVDQFGDANGVRVALDLLKTHTLHLAGHRFQVRYVRGTYSRAHGTTKADFDPW